MCGIAGIVGAPSRGVLDAMLTALDHRGPDDRGVHVSGGAGLGMTRLAIIDLVTGRQPMTGEDGAATIVFNGEIYNFRAVRAELEAAGHRFRTQSDTEVILRAWQADEAGAREQKRPFVQGSFRRGLATGNEMPPPVHVHPVDHTAPGPAACP